MCEIDIFFFVIFVWLDMVVFIGFFVIIIVLNKLLFLDLMVEDFELKKFK